jgi:hypothetical protein
MKLFWLLVHNARMFFNLYNLTFNVVVGRNCKTYEGLKTRCVIGAFGDSKQAKRRS